jgi:hypothetical protein
MELSNLKGPSSKNKDSKLKKLDPDHDIEILFDRAIYNLSNI